LAKEEDITILSTLKIKAVVFAFLAQSMAMYNIGFFTSFFAIRLKSYYGIPVSQIGYYFAILSASYLVGAVVLPMITTTTPRKLLFVINFFVSAIALMFMGPSQWVFSFGDHPPVSDFYLILIGLPLLGFIQILCLVFALPEAIEVYQV